MLGEGRGRRRTAAGQEVAHCRQQVLLLGNEMPDDVGAELLEQLGRPVDVAVRAEVGQHTPNRRVVTAQDAVDRVGHLGFGHSASLIGPGVVHAHECAYSTGVRPSSQVSRSYPYARLASRTSPY